MESLDCGFEQYRASRLAEAKFVGRLMWRLGNFAASFIERLTRLMTRWRPVRITPQRTVRVVVHILKPESDPRTDEQLNGVVKLQIDALNRDFGGQQTAPADAGRRAIDSGIRFELASNGCRIKNVADELEVEADQARQQCPPADGTHVLNIWVANLNRQYGSGYGDFPWWTHQRVHGVFIRTEYFGDTGISTIRYNRGALCTHEVGHWLGLEHLPTDNLHDTCDSMPENFMDPASDDHTWRLFTPRQVSRMRYYLARYRPGTH